MSSRSDVPVRKDQAIFRRTARETKRVNLPAMNMRGGIRF